MAAKKRKSKKKTVKRKAVKKKTVKRKVVKKKTAKKTTTKRKVPKRKVAKKKTSVTIDIESKMSPKRVGRKVKVKKPSLGVAIVGLLLNVLVLPGLGSLIGKRFKPGIAQILLFLIGMPLMLVWVGFIMVIAAWIWGLVTGIMLIQDAV